MWHTVNTVLEQALFLVHLSQFWSHTIEKSNVNTIVVFGFLYTVVLICLILWPWSIGIQCFFINEKYIPESWKWHLELQHKLLCEGKWDNKLWWLPHVKVRYMQIMVSLFYDICHDFAPLLHLNINPNNWHYAIQGWKTLLLLATHHNTERWRLLSHAPVYGSFMNNAVSMKMGR